MACSLAKVQLGSPGAGNKSRVGSSWLVFRDVSNTGGQALLIARCSGAQTFGGPGEKGQIGPTGPTGSSCGDVSCLACATEQ